MPPRSSRPRPSRWARPRRRRSPRPASESYRWPTRLDDRRAESACDQFHRGRRCGVLAIEDRVHLDDLERAGAAALGDGLEREVRLPIAQSPANRRADPGRDFRIECIHVEGDVHEPWTRHMVDGLPHRTLDPDAIDLAHREDADADFTK